MIFALASAVVLLCPAADAVVADHRENAGSGIPVGLLIRNVVQTDQPSESPETERLAANAGSPETEADANGPLFTPSSTDPGPTAGAATLMLLLTVFVLAVFVGFEIITKIPPTLHTPLMSGSNAISGITLVGAMLAAGSSQSALATVLGVLAVILATMNVVGGFLVTNRMLAMFRRRT